MAVVGEAGLGADGSDDCIGSGFGIGAFFDHTVEGEAHVAPAEFEEPEGVSVAVDGVFGDFVVDGDRAGGSPVEEVEFDQVAVGVIANVALTAVALFDGCSGEVDGALRAGTCGAEATSRAAG